MAVGLRKCRLFQVRSVMLLPKRKLRSKWQPSDFGAFLVPLDGRPRNLPDTAACGDVRGGDFGGLLFASQREACRNP